ncbi:MAG: GntP family permease [Gammaproteobacteria bacterium]|uniref:GntP family permease n=1 Tax=Rhodoferax sp. TaxID=50421 RepID=UPI00184EB80A|nr:GntP family permease [Rhodoferax sp.]MBU3900974.1 GntP family permease [Gammaproteobacteria bacterium]MBA3058334.1 GntP family permease [Rhodoferax sp.]MBU3996797.1 GntP family permease [Gammaproteobacteria bacterium]MBU4017648.1 GntP family permease [Gammaproteobacteria bacterium]MBU4081091.1 GntP family permease [Gammaproteobacteria bacterium]
MNLSILAILLSLALLMYLAYRGVSVLILAPLMALLAVLGSPGTPLLASYTQVFMKALGGFIALYFPLFLLGALFGRLMESSGAARVIALRIVDWLGADRAVLAIVLACAVLTYGGVSLFVVAFAVYPLAVALFQAADVPKRLMPATIALGAFTFTMTALPGTPAIQNAIPMPFFGTTPFAAPGLGVIGGAIMLVLGVWWLGRRVRQAAAAGEGYGVQADDVMQLERSVRPHALGEGYDVVELGPQRNGDAAPVVLPGFAVALAPIVAVVALNWLFSTQLLPRLDSSYLDSELYGATRLDAVRGVWAIIAALTLSILLLIGLAWRSLPNLRQDLDAGANAAVLPIFNTASQVGYGAVIASLVGFALIRDAVLGIAPGQPLISLSIAVNLLAGITGSASGGMSIALQTLGSAYLQMGRDAGISPELLHRVTSIATGGLDALPHNGAVITLLAICKLTHRQSYVDILVVAVITPLAALAAVVLLGTLLGSF